jgi:hypothetical protein
LFFLFLLISLNNTSQQSLGSSRVTYITRPPA